MNSIEIEEREKIEAARKENYKTIYNFLIGHFKQAYPDTTPRPEGGFLFFGVILKIDPFDYAKINSKYDPISYNINFPESMPPEKLGVGIHIDPFDGTDGSKRMNIYFVEVPGMTQERREYIASDRLFPSGKIEKFQDFLNIETFSEVTAHAIREKKLKSAGLTDMVAIQNPFTPARDRVYRAPVTIRRGFIS